LQVKEVIVGTYHHILISKYQFSMRHPYYCWRQHRMDVVKLLNSFRGGWKSKLRKTEATKFACDEFMTKKKVINVDLRSFDWTTINSIGEYASRTGVQQQKPIREREKKRTSKQLKGEKPKLKSLLMVSQQQIAYKDHGFV